MRTIIFIIFSLLLIQCKNESGQLALLNGKINHSSLDTLRLTGNNGNHITTADRDGNFQFKLKVDDGYYKLSVKDIQVTLFLNPTDTLNMTFDLVDFNKSINYSGKSEEINKKLISLSKGKPAPEFSYKDIKGNLVSLTDFKGKYIYIDVWSTTCGSCRKGLPKLEELIESYKSKNIVFLGVSLDSKIEKWRKFVEEKSMKGIQLFGEGWNSQFTKDYAIESNPRFILIDKNQNIIDIYAPSPSENIDNVLKNLEGI
jgi:peroxiredoxin